MPVHLPSTSRADAHWQVRELVQNYESDPANIPRIRSTLNEASKDIILLVEVRKQQQQQQQQQQQRDRCQVLAFLEESMRSMGPDADPRYETRPPSDAAFNVT